MVTIAFVNPDNQTLRPSVGSSYKFKVVPTDSLTGSPYDLTLDTAIDSAMIVQSTSSQKLVSNTFVVGLVSQDATGAVFQIGETDLAGIVELGLGLIFTGYIRLTDGLGGTVLVWAGQLQIQANPAQIVAFT